MKKKERDEKGRFLEGNETSTLGGKPKAFNSVKDFQDTIDGYLESCQGIKNGQVVYTKQPLKSGLAYYAGCSKDTINEYSKKSGYSESYKIFEAKCEHFAEQALYRVKGSPAGAIFNLKANYGYQDKLTLDHQNGGGVLGGINIRVVTEKQVPDDEDDYESTSEE